MAWEAWTTLAAVVLLVVGLVRRWAGPDLLLLGGLAILMAVGVISGSDRLPTPKDAVVGFGHAGPITVGLLFVVVEGMVRTGAMTRITGPTRCWPPSDPSSGFKRTTGWYSPASLNPWWTSRRYEA